VKGGKESGSIKLRAGGGNNLAKLVA